MKKPRLKIFWPNIGSIEDYQKNLQKILKAVHNNEFRRVELIKWIKVEFASSSTHFCRKLVDIIKSIGLLRISDKKVNLTTEAETYLQTEDTDLLIDLILKNVVGFSEMIEVLKERGSSSFEEIRIAWEDRMAPHKFSLNQSGIRINWLRALGYADMVARRYFLTNKGLKLSTRIKQDQVETIDKKEEVTHNDLEDKVKIIGEFFEFEATKRVSVNKALPTYALKLKKSDRELDCLWVKYIPFAGSIKFPIEIQLSGNLADTLDRLETVSEYVQKAIIITTEEQEKTILERLKVKKSRLLEKVIFVYIDDIFKAVEATNVLQSLTKKIFKE
jgi:DNA-directed RNA polymerase subunit H (RpoH/RPB5)